MSQKTKVRVRNTVRGISRKLAMVCEKAEVRLGDRRILIDTNLGGGRVGGAQYVKGSREEPSRLIVWSGDSPEGKENYRQFGNYGLTNKIDYVKIGHEVHNFKELTSEEQKRFREEYKILGKKLIEVNWWKV